MADAFITIQMEILLALEKSGRSKAEAQTLLDKFLMLSGKPTTMELLAERLSIDQVYELQP
jgi:hypothetical protein